MARKSGRPAQINAASFPGYRDRGIGGEKRPAFKGLRFPASYSFAVMRTSSQRIAACREVLNPPQSADLQVPPRNVPKTLIDSWGADESSAPRFFARGSNSNRMRVFNSMRRSGAAGGRANRFSSQHFRHILSAGPGRLAISVQFHRSPNRIRPTLSSCA